MNYFCQFLCSEPLHRISTFTDVTRSHCPTVLILNWMKSEAVEWFQKTTITKKNEEFVRCVFDVCKKVTFLICSEYPEIIFYLLISTLRLNLSGVLDVCCACCDWLREWSKSQVLAVQSLRVSEREQQIISNLTEMRLRLQFFFLFWPTNLSLPVELWKLPTKFLMNSNCELRK